MTSLPKLIYLIPGTDLPPTSIVFLAPVCNAVDLHPGSEYKKKQVMSRDAPISASPSFSMSSNVRTPKVFAFVF